MLKTKERINSPLFKELSNSPALTSVYNNIGTFKYTNSLVDKKISVVVGAKNEKKAVLRNKLKRRIYSVFSKIPIKIMGILFTSKKSTKMDFNEIKHSINDLLEKIKKNTK